MNKFSQLCKKVLSSDNKIKVFVLVGLIGMSFILLSEMIPKKAENTKKEDLSYYEYIENLEQKTEDIVSSIDGVGECKVMLTLTSTNESVYAKNSDEKNDSSSYSKKYEYVLYDSANGDEPILIKQYLPTVQGVVVVCSGGDNVVVKERIISSISSLYNLPSTKITVSKFKG